MILEEESIGGMNFRRRNSRRISGGGRNLEEDGATKEEGDLCAQGDFM